MTVEDNDPPGVNLTELDEPVTEGDSATYGVVLNSLPTGAVAIDLRVTGDADVTVDPPSLVFDRDTWDIEQRVTVAAAHDDDAGDDSATVGHAINRTGTTAGEYRSLRNLPSLAVTVDDDETAGVTVSVPTLAVNETIQTSYTVRLDTPPSTGNVVVTVTSDNADVTVSPARLTFRANNWDQPQSVTVRAGADADQTDDTATLRHAIDAGRTGAPEYDALTDLSGADVTVTVTDNDVVGITVSKTGLTLTEGRTATYTLRLNTRPTASRDDHPGERRRDPGQRDARDAHVHDHELEPRPDRDRAGGAGRRRRGRDGDDLPHRRLLRFGLRRHRPRLRGRGGERGRQRADAHGEADGHPRDDQRGQRRQHRDRDRVARLRLGRRRHRDRGGGPGEHQYGAGRLQRRRRRRRHFRGGDDQQRRGGDLLRWRTRTTATSPSASPGRRPAA